VWKDEKCYLGEFVSGPGDNQELILDVMYKGKNFKKISEVNPTYWRHLELFIRKDNNEELSLVMRYLINRRIIMNFEKVANDAENLKNNIIDNIN